MVNEKIEYLNLDLLHPFENNPFQSVDESDLSRREGIQSNRGFGGSYISTKYASCPVHGKYIQCTAIVLKEGQLPLELLSSGSGHTC